MRAKPEDIQGYLDQRFSIVSFQQKYMPMGLGWFSYHHKCIFFFPEAKYYKTFSLISTVSANSSNHSPHLHMGSSSVKAPPGDRQQYPDLFPPCIAESVKSVKPRRLKHTFGKYEKPEKSIHLLNLLRASELNTWKCGQLCSNDWFILWLILQQKMEWICVSLSLWEHKRQLEGNMKINFYFSGNPVGRSCHWKLPHCGSGSVV